MTKHCNPWATIQERIVACERCADLRAYTAEISSVKRRAYATEQYWGKPVPAFGNCHARLALVGLAPGAHGSNRTGRMFTGDSSGDFLYPALYRAGFASQPRATDRNDGMCLHDCVITSAARCAPPQNKPTPQELRNCFPYLVEEIRLMRRLRVVVGLGSIGTKAAIDALRNADYAVETRGFTFGHLAELAATGPAGTVTLLASYHPSRQNTNTGKLTAEMLDMVFARANAIIGDDR